MNKYNMARIKTRISAPLTYGQLVAQIKFFKKEYKHLDIDNQPVTFIDPQAADNYYVIGDLVREPDGHFSMLQE